MTHYKFTVEALNPQSKVPICSGVHYIILEFTGQLRLIHSPMLQFSASFVC